MRKYLPLLLLALPFTSDAQFSKSTMFVGGSFGFNTTTTPSIGTATSFSIAPTFGYFLSDRLAIGSGINYSYGRSSYVNPSQVNKNKGYSALPFVRYYVPLAKNFYFVASAQYSIGTSNSTSSNDNSSAKSFNMGLTLTPKFVFFPTPYFSVEAGLGSLGWNYSHSGESDPNYHTNSLSLSGGGISLGAAWYFHNKLQKE